MLRIPEGGIQRNSFGFLLPLSMAEGGWTGWRVGLKMEGWPPLPAADCERKSANAGDKEPWDGEMGSPPTCGALPRHLKEQPLFPISPTGSQVPVWLPARHNTKCGCQWERLSRCVGRGHSPAGERGWEDRSQRRTDNPTESLPARSLASPVTATAASYSYYSYFIGGAGGSGHPFAPFPPFQAGAFLSGFPFTVRVSRDTQRLTSGAHLPSHTQQEWFLFWPWLSLWL